MKCRSANYLLGSTWALTAIVLSLAPGPLVAGGLYRDGAGARAMALGGAEVGLPDEPLEALHSNPAGLSLLNTPTLQFGLGAALAEGDFSNAANPHGTIREGAGVWPDAALAFPLKSVPVTLGIAVIPEAILGAEWKYVDSQGAGGTNYGAQKYRSEIVTVRTAIGASVAVNEKLSLGAALGIVYNRNLLRAPYIFQNYPGLQGAKTLLDLRTDGWGLNGTFGLVYRPTQKLSFGLSYQTAMQINSKGDANGNADNQFIALGAGAQGNFHYDAEVVNVFPQTVSAGASWQMCSRVRGVLQIDWINWSDAFDNLKIHLRNGDNAGMNGILGTANIYDIVPLRWRDQWVYRVGLEFQASDEIALRLGYAYANSAVPDGTLLPLTAAIMEHKITAGIGWQHKRYSLDFAYQYDLPASQSVGTSGLAGGEYSNSRTEVNVHWFALTAGINF